MNSLPITRETLRALTDSGSWDRGVGYFEQGRVFRLMVDEGAVTARVVGTHEYQVELYAHEGRLYGDCTCPMGERGVFCKHCVATGLECLETGIRELGGEGRPSSEPDTEAGDIDPAVTDIESIRDCLRDEDTEELVEIIISQAKADDSLLRRLIARAALKSDEGLNVDAFKSAIRAATSSMDFVDYGAAYAFAAGVDEVVDEVEDLLRDGHAEEVVELSEYAIEEVEGALGYVDDSDGRLGDVFYRLQELHHEACLAAEPDPRELAGRLFRRELTSDFGAFSGAVAVYADVLGEEGRAEYRKLAEEQWEGLPPLEPGERRSHDHRRYMLTRIMETLAEASGDVEERVAIKSRDLSAPYSYLQVAEVYRKARQYNKAMEWARKGLEAFPEHPDPRLGEFLANEYHRRGRHAEAMELMWPQFVEGPGLRPYEKIKTHAERAGDWPRWRERARQLLTEDADRRRAEADGRAGRWRRTAPGSDLVAVYLWENATDAAWKAAQEYGCGGRQWLELASLREEEHPRQAIEIYQEEVGQLVEQTNNAAYRDATRLVRKIQDLMARLGGRQEFEEYVESLRTEFKRKRNFMKMLNEFD